MTCYCCLPNSDLPVLPNQTLDHYATFSVGTVSAVDTTARRLDVALATERRMAQGDELEVFAEGVAFLGAVSLIDVGPGQASGLWKEGAIERVQPGMPVRGRLGIPFVEVMLAALNPYRLWLIVVLVSLVSFLGYVLIQVIGSRAGIGLTGVIGGLVSSTVTTLSFARRSKEAPDANRLFALAVLLASSVMFPRLILEIAVFNQVLMARIALPLGAMGLTGLLLATYLYRRSREHSVDQPKL